MIFSGSSTGSMKLPEREFSRGGAQRDFPRIAGLRLEWLGLICLVAGRLLGAKIPANAAVIRAGAACIRVPAMAIGPVATDRRCSGRPSGSVVWALDA